MLFGLLGRPKDTTTPPGDRKAARRARLGVETLEGRLVPAAIRNLPGFLVNNLPANDDNTTGAVNIGFNINFFGVQESQCFVSNNGIITLQQPDPTFTPNGLTTPQAEPIIAPFWADVDTRAASSLVTYGTDTLCGHQVFGVDWVHVNYFDATATGHVNKYDDFQLILINRSDTGAGNFDIEFNYNSITWETGDASGGTNGLGGQSAHAGYSNGSGTAGTFFELPGSGVNGAFLNGGPDALATHLLNASTPGRYHFFVRNGLVMQETTDVSKGLDITSLVNTFHPYRYVYNPSDHTYRGSLTILERPPQNVTNINACLDEMSQQQNILAGTFQVTVVYENLPPGVTLLNPTGYTASGKPYISAGVVNFGPGLAVRIPVRFSNPRHVPLSTFMIGPDVRVFGGPFNPAGA